ncbi:MAG: hypothetical protein U9Q27_02575 [Patescibacteria group bacterium]|nr:hypothetical protein [Patescibacteria group bacterium]
MLIFEFYINPKIKNTALNSFCYNSFDAKQKTREDIEKKSASELYIAHFARVSEKNAKIIDFNNLLAQEIKKNFYLKKNLRQIFKKINFYLQKQIKNNNIFWFNNLNIAVLNIIPKKNLYNVNFTKTGNIKFLLIREKQIINIAENLESKNLFEGIASGQLLKNDKILILSNEIFSAFTYFKKQNILDEIANLDLFDYKKIKKILEKHKKNLNSVTGICAFISLDKKNLALNEKQKYTFFFNSCHNEPKFNKNSLKLFLTTKNFSKFFQIKTSTNFIKQIKKQKWSKDALACFMTNITKTALEIFANLKKFLFSKFGLCAFILIFILMFGSFIFKENEEKQIKQTQEQLEEIKTKILRAESFLIINNEKQAKILFQEAWEKINNLTNQDETTKQSVNEIKKTIENHINDFNQIKKIENPFVWQDIIPEKLFAREKYNLTSSWKNSILVFESPNQLTRLKNNEIQEKIFLADLTADFNPQNFCVYSSNLYFLNTVSGEIIKYAGNSLRDNTEIKKIKWEKPKIWTQSNSLINAKSMTMDNSVWILNSENKIDRYYAGRYEQTLEINIFPKLKNLEKIYTSPSLSYFYILDPSENRIIVLDKKSLIDNNSKVIKQFTSEKFNNLIDFSISTNEKTIYLLNNSIIYKIEF